MSSWTLHDGRAVVMCDAATAVGIHADAKWNVCDGVVCIDAAPAPSMNVIEMPSWINPQPSAKCMAEADLISGFYAGVPFETGKRRHDEYLQRKAERSLQR